MADYFSTVNTLLARLQSDDYRSYDHYDFWGSATGVALRGKRSVLALPLVGAAYIAEILFPMRFREGVERKVAMETLVYILRSMHHYRKATGDERYEADRARLLEHMVAHLGSSEHGRGVGHQFDWYTGTLIPAYTPCVTFTSYLVDYLLTLGGDAPLPDALDAVLRDVGEFVCHDLRPVRDGDVCKVSYTPLDDRHVVNANAYAARIMYRLGKRFGRNDYLEMARGLLNYVLNEQNDDGSWFYFEKGSVPDRKNFVDCFHSAFVLENLIEWAFVEHDERAEVSLDAGIYYFVKAFVNRDASVNHFSKSHLPIPIYADTRSFAEAVNFLAMVSPHRPEYLKIALRVYYRAKEEMYDAKEHYFYFRKYPFHLSRMHYIRWATAPMLNAVTTLGLVTGEVR